MTTAVIHTVNAGRVVTVPPMESHVIAWELNNGYLTGTCRCRSEIGADCRLESGDGCFCEAWTVERDEAGAFHMAGDERHDLTPSLGCNVEDWLNADPSLLPELYGGRFVIAETEINPIWIGDGCDWEPKR